MYPPEEQLEEKWWHRMMKVLRWVSAIGILVSLALVPIYGGYKNEELLIRLSLAVGYALIAYYAFWLIYKKIILYIVFGRKTK